MVRIRAPPHSGTAPSRHAVPSGAHVGPRSWPLTVSAGESPFTLVANRRRLRRAVHVVRIRFPQLVRVHECPRRRTVLLGCRCLDGGGAAVHRERRRRRCRRACDRAPRCPDGHGGRRGHRRGGARADRLGPRGLAGLGSLCRVRCRQQRRLPGAGDDGRHPLVPGRQPLHRHVHRIHRSVRGRRSACTRFRPSHSPPRCLDRDALVRRRLLGRDRTDSVAARAFLAAGILNRAYPRAARSRRRSLQPLFHRCDDRLRRPDGGAGGRHRPSVQPPRDSHRPHRRIDRRVLAGPDEHLRSPLGRLPAGGRISHPHSHRGQPCHPGIGLGRPRLRSDPGHFPARHRRFRVERRQPSHAATTATRAGVRRPTLPAAVRRVARLLHHWRRRRPTGEGIIHDASSYAGSFGTAAIASAVALAVFIAAGALPGDSDAAGERRAIRRR